MLPLLLALLTPQVSVADATANLARLAIELASQELPPIPLDPDGTTPHGVIYDRLRLAQLVARDSILRGKPMDPNAPPPALTTAGIVIVAYPLVCDGKPNLPQSIQMIAGGREGAPAGPPTRGPAPTTRLPGVSLPPGSLAVPFPNLPVMNAIAIITYAGPACPGTTNDITLRLTSTGSRPAQGTTPPVSKFPADVTGLPSPTTVHVQAQMGLDGRLRFPKAADGPASLAAAAEAIVGNMRFEPGRVNGAPVTTILRMPVTFSETGVSTAAPAPVPVMTSNTASSTISSRPMPGLTRKDSRCAISDDVTYGVTVANPIRVGGEAFDGPTRARQYLGALRGPAGQGLTFRRIGALRGPDQTILDRYEITYDGLATAITMYVDQYRFEELKAPSDLICGLEIGLVAPDPSRAPRPITPSRGDPGAPATPTGPGVPAFPTLLATADVPNLTAATSQCGVAADDNYGTSPASPIKIGGGAEGAAREMQYMTVLRGPAGEGLRYQRAGAMLSPDQETPLSVMEIVSIGARKLEKPVRLYFSRLTAEDPKAVKGFACAQPIAAK